MENSVDCENMEQVILDSPGQLLAGLKSGAETPAIAGKFSRIVLAGMGGSWMGAALMEEAGLLSVPLTIHRGYGLPPD